jgi:hypothetical protein
MGKDEYHRGQRLGYLDYHATVLEERIDELDAELHGIRQRLSGDERKVKEQQALLDFREDVKQRNERIQYQLSGVKKHEEEETQSVATTQYESAYDVHQRDDIDKIPADSDGFSAASEMD